MTGTIAHHFRKQKKPGFVEVTGFLDIFEKNGFLDILEETRFLDLKLKQNYSRLRQPCHKFEGIGLASEF